jgi:hypothetical protein
MKNIYRKINRKNYSLADLVEIINSCSKNSKEATAALTDLFASGRVLIRSHGQLKRVRPALG